MSNKKLVADGADYYVYLLHLYCDTVYARRGASVWASLWQPCTDRVQSA